MNKVSTVITRQKITMEILPSSVFIPNTNSATNIYTIILKKGRMTLKLPQADRKQKVPNIVTVVEALVEDSAIFEKAGRNYNAWCQECGCSTDDEVAKREFKQVLWYADALQKLLGEDSYREVIKDWQDRNNSTITFEEDSDE